MIAEYIEHGGNGKVFCWNFFESGENSGGYQSYRRKRGIGESRLTSSAFNGIKILAGNNTEMVLSILRGRIWLMS